MPSDTNPLPAAQLLKLADALADAPDTAELIIRRGAYRAARAASPVTAEEVDAARYRCIKPMFRAVSLDMSNLHRLGFDGRELERGWDIENAIDRTIERDNARRLAGEGGA